MSALHIRMFGTFHLLRKERPREPQMRPGVKAILAYLILFRNRLHAREVLAGHFWGDYAENRARNCLCTSLWRLRGLLEPKPIPRGTYLVTTANGEVGFNPQGDYWLDVEDFEKACEIALTKPCQVLGDADVRVLRGALELYTGELLEGSYEEWAIFERERLRLLYIRSQSHLMKYYRYHRNLDAALACGREVLNLDPLREEVHRAMMRLYAEARQRTMALRQYEICKDVLEDEMKIPPMVETRNLRDRIRQETVRTRQPGSSEWQVSEAEQVMARLTGALTEFEQSASRLRNMASLLQQMMKPKP
jgi:DNA-binding SARP family transcriptional activator